MTNKLLQFLKKEEGLVEKEIKPYERNPMNYTIHQRIIVIGFSMAILSLYSKFINIGHWMFTDFDLSSYPPDTAYIYMLSSLLAFMYGYYKKDKILETIGMIGIAYTVLFVMGIINTYYWGWVWWT